VPSASPRGGSVSLEVVDAAHLRAANGQRTTQTSGEGKVSDRGAGMVLSLRGQIYSARSAEKIFLLAPSNFIHVSPKFAL
jgi:hypothetical protein